MSLSSLLRTIWRVGWWSLTAMMILLVLLLGTARLLLPDVGPYRQQIADWVGAQLQRPIRIEHLAISWRILEPSVTVEGLTILNETGTTPILKVAAAHVDLDIWASLLSWHLQPGELALQGIDLSLLRMADGKIIVAGLPNLSDADSELAHVRLRQWLRRHHQLHVQDGILHWHDLMTGEQGTFAHLDLVLLNSHGRHQLQGSVDLPNDLGRQLAVQADIHGDLLKPGEWYGTLDTKGSELKLESRTLRQLWPNAVFRGTVTGNLKSRWQGGLAEVTGTLHADGLQWTTGAGAGPSSGQTLNLSKLAGQVHWLRRAGGGILNVNDLVVTSGSVPWPTTQMRVFWQRQPTGGRTFELNYGYVRLEDALALVEGAGLVPAGLRDKLVRMAPHGELLNSQLFYKDGGTGRQWLLNSGFRALTAQPVAPWPGLNNLSGHLNTDGTQGVLQIAGEQVKLDFQQLFRKPLTAHDVQGQLFWRHDNGDLVVSGDKLLVHSEDINIKGALYYRLPVAGGSPYVDLAVKFDGGNAQHVSRYLPVKIMSPATVDWVDRAIRGGTISGGTAELRGHLADFPYTHSNGEFEVHFKLTDGTLDYAAGWPPLEHINALLGFVGHGLQIDASTGRSFNSDVTEAHVNIPDLSAKPAVLTLQGKAQGPTADVLRYLRETPLKERFATYVSDMSAEGLSRLQLNLKIPLAAEAVEVQGVLTLLDANLALHEAGIDFTHIDGDLGFSSAGLHARDIRAHIFGQPSTVSIRTVKAGSASSTLFEAKGSADAVTIAKRYASFLVPYLQGTLNWEGSFSTSSPEGPILKIRSNLAGMAVHLPEPLAKPSEQPNALTVELPLPIKPAHPLHISYGPELHGLFALTSAKEGVALDRGELRFGGAKASLPEQSGLRIAGDIPRFIKVEWDPILWPRQTENSATTNQTAVNALELKVGQLLAFGRVWDRLSIHAAHALAAWTADLIGTQVVGHVVVPDDPNAAATATLDSLSLSSAQGTSGGQELDPRDMQPMVLSARDFHYGGQDLGQLQLHTTHQALGLNVSQLTLAAASYQLQAQGRWEIKDNQPRSAFNIQLDSSDVGRSLSTFGYADMIKGGTAHAEMQLNWPGSPSSFSLDHVSGSLVLKIKEGRLLDVEPGAGRILGLISFGALPRRLSLDFSDLFGKGFAFDQIEGNFKIEDGNAFTDNLHMYGPAARIEARGRVGLRAEDYDQHVSVTPDVSAALPLTGAIYGPPGVAIGWLIQQLIHTQVNSIARAEYRVSGSWAQPVVERESAQHLP